MSFSAIVQEDSKIVAEIYGDPKKFLEHLEQLEAEIPGLQAAARQAEQNAALAATANERAEQKATEATEAANVARTMYQNLKKSSTPINKGVLDDAEAECQQATATAGTAETALKTAKEDVESADRAAADAQRAYNEAADDLAAKKTLAEDAKRALEEKQNELDDRKRILEIVEATQKAVGEIGTNIKDLTKEVRKVGDDVKAAGPKKSKITILLF